MGLDEENIPNDSDPLIWRQTESSPSPDGLDEIKDDEADANSSACCRICLESDTFPGDLILAIELFLPFCLRSFLVNLSFLVNSCYI